MISSPHHKFPLLILAFSIATALSGCGKREESTSKPVSGDHKATLEEHAGERQLTLSAEERETAGIKTAEFKTQSFVDQVVLTATIRANEDRIAHVAPRVSARITEVKARLGDYVKKGQALALLDSIELGEAHSAYQQAQSQFSLATSDFERAQKLNAEEIIPEKDYLRARSEYEKARAALRAADDKLRLLDVEHRDTEKGTGSVFPLRSPFAGTVIEKDAVLGELARPDKNIFTVADLSMLWIEADLFEKDLHRVRVGAPASVTVGAYPDELFKGRLTYISSTMDKDTRTVRARVEVPNTGARLKPEMFATASIETASTTQAITLPQEAVLLINGQPTAFVQEGVGFEARALDLGDKLGGRVVIRGGIKQGEHVVIAGAYVLKARMLKSQIGDAH